jgi:hypothetical protein
MGVNDIVEFAQCCLFCYATHASTLILNFLQAKISYISSENF